MNLSKKIATPVLNTRVHAAIALQDVLKQCAPLLKEAIALLYSPTRCEFAQLNAEGELTCAPDSKIDLATVFEARVFNSTAELRWLNERNGVGRAALLSEEDISDYFDASFTDGFEYIATIPQTYLLWGERFEPAPEEQKEGWSKLTAARIGAIAVPVANLSKNQRVVLKTVEYVAVVDEHGNAAVIEERLEKLEVAS